jgi:hypothetical protein
VIDELPFELMDRYGASDYYTVGQAQQTAESLGLKQDLLPFALAAVCDLEGFLQGMPNDTETDYLSLREALIKLFHISKAGFTCRDLSVPTYSKFSNSGGNSMPGIPGGG